MNRLLASICLTLPAMALVACGGSAGESPTAPRVLGQGLESSAPSERLTRGNDRYDGTVVGTDPSIASFELDDGTVVKTSASTRWKSGGDRVVSVAAMADAIAVGMTVRARGKATAESPGVLFAEDVDARIERDAAAEDQRFDDEVANSNGTTITLIDGTELAFSAATRWKSGPDRLTSVAAVAEAVQAGLSVRARGRARSQSGATPLVLEIDARVREATTTGFRGTLTAVDTLSGELVLDGDTAILVLTATTWKRGPRRIGSLADLATAFEAGASISVRGKGTRQTDSIAASELDVQFAAPALARFRGLVDTVDEEAGTILLQDGQVISTFDGTDWRRGGRWLGSLAAIAQALADGDVVRVTGKGTDTGGGNVLAALVKARVRRVPTSTD